MKNINILIYGSSAREHAAALAISQSPLTDTLYTMRDFKIPDAKLFQPKGKNLKAIAQEAAGLGINLVIILDEKILCSGAADIFNKAGIAPIGVNKQFSQLEKSKLFCKKFMDEYGINNVPDAELENYAKNILAQEKEGRRVLEQVEDTKTIAAVKNAVTVKNHKISVEKFRELK